MLLVIVWHAKNIVLREAKNCLLLASSCPTRNGKRQILGTLLPGNLFGFPEGFERIFYRAITNMRKDSPRSRR